MQPITIDVPADYTRCKKCMVNLYELDPTNKTVARLMNWEAKGCNFKDNKQDTPYLYEFRKGGTFQVKVSPLDRKKCRDPIDTVKTFKIGKASLLRITVKEKSTKKINGLGQVPAVPAPMEISSKVREHYNQITPAPNHSKFSLDKTQNRTTATSANDIISKTSKQIGKTKTFEPEKPIITLTTKMSERPTTLSTNNLKSIIQPTTDTGRHMSAITTSVALVCCLTMISFAAFYIKRKRKETRRRIACVQKPTNVKQPQKRRNISLSSDSNQESPYIFVINAEDHQHHVKTVEAFARFLDHHSDCHVIYAPWCLHEYLENKGRWVSQAIQKANYIILINSELAYHQNKAWVSQEKRNWHTADANLTSDLFILSIREIVKYFKVPYCIGTKPFKNLVINFDYTPNKYSVASFNAEFEFYIPADMKELLYQLKAKENSQTNSHDSGEFDTTMLLSSTDGKELIQCINTSTYFEKQHPLWFNAFYGITERFDSGFSSPVCSIQTTSSAEQSSNNNDAFVYYSSRQTSQDSHPQNNLSNGISRSISVEDNTLVETVFSVEAQYYDTSRHSEFLADSGVSPDFFEEPSIVGDDDVLSQQLRREIYELNNRMMKSQMQNGFIARGLSREDEIISLGGQSV